MIQANELRLGNLMNFANLGDDQIFHKIDFSDIELAYVKPIGFNKTYKPIPITAEWLEKLGFEKSQISDNPIDGFYYNLRFTDNKYCDLSFITGDKNGFMEVCLFPYEDNFRYKYVHELQNLFFAITKQELTIK